MSMSWHFISVNRIFRKGVQMLSGMNDCFVGLLNTHAYLILRSDDLPRELTGFVCFHVALA